MKKNVFNVFPIYLKPLSESWECVRIGLLFHCHKRRTMAYKIESAQSETGRRALAFFSQVSETAYENAVKTTIRNIEHVKNQMYGEGGDGLDNTPLLNLVRPRENFIRYGSPVAIQAASLLDAETSFVAERR